MVPATITPNTKESLADALKPEPDETLDYDEYFDDEPQRKPKGKSLRKFRHPAERQ